MGGAKSVTSGMPLRRFIRVAYMAVSAASNLGYGLVNVQRSRRARNLPVVHSTLEPPGHHASPEDGCVHRLIAVGRLDGAAADRLE